MNKEVISDKQGIAAIVLYMSGTSSMLVFGTVAEKDIWVATILAILMTLCIVLVFCHMHSMFPGKNLFDICDICFGRFIGKGIIILYVWFALHSGTLVGMNIYQFITETILPATPNTAVFILLLFLCSWIVKKGIEVIGRWSEFMIIPFIILVFTVILFFIPDMDINNIRPVLSKGMKPILEGAFAVFSFPFGEIVIFTIIFSDFKSNKSPYRIYIGGLFIAGIVVFITSLGTILYIGINSASEPYYPIYEAVKRIDVGFILQNLEPAVAVTFVLGGFLKVSIYLLATCKGVVSIFKLKDYRFIVIPIVLIMLNMSYFVHLNRVDYNKWNFEIFPYYAFLFEMILPIIIWITAQIKFKKFKYKKSI
ncbi:MAG: endospore germination permease [Maledivibacter sp.]|nr:endospore germination permease [Maledivibacter sp.]